MQIHEPAREMDVWGEFDLCVNCGSSTRVLAVVRAARLAQGRSIVS